MPDESDKVGAMKLPPGKSCERLIQVGIRNV